MRIIILVSFLSLISCLNSNQYSEVSRIIKFEKFIGHKKALALNEKVANFETFLNENYPRQSLKDAYEKYLEVIRDGEYDKINWRYNMTNQDSIENLFERNGLREEIWNYEDSDPITEQRVRKFNRFGKYLKGLELIQGSDSTIINYIKIKKAVGDVSKNILADGLLKSNADFSDYFIKRIIVVEFYPAN